MDKTEKDRYFQYARQVDAEHKKKFPGINHNLNYIFNDVLSEYKPVLYFSLFLNCNAVWR